MIRYSTLPALFIYLFIYLSIYLFIYLSIYLFIVKTGAGAHSLTAGKAENVPHLRIKRNQIVDAVVIYCDFAVGIKTTNKISLAPVVNFTSGNSFCWPCCWNVPDIPLEDGPLRTETRRSDTVLINACIRRFSMGNREICGRMWSR